MNLCLLMHIEKFATVHLLKHSVFTSVGYMSADGTRNFFGHEQRHAANFFAGGGIAGTQFGSF